MAQSVVQRSFSGGEWSPSLGARADLARYHLALRTCRNFLVQKHGGVANRAGFGFIEEIKTSAATGTFLFPYLADDPNESILIEAGNGYLRFYKDGARVEVTHASVTAWSNVTAYTVGDLADTGGVVYYCILAHTNQTPPNATYWYALSDASAGVAIYEVPTPFTAGFRWNQSGPIVTLTDLSVAMYELIFLSLTRWVVQIVTIAPGVSAPTNLTATAGTVGAGPAGQWQIAVTSAAPGTFEESMPVMSSRFQALVPTPTAPNIYEWTKATVGGVDCPEYYVYRDSTNSGTLEFIGVCKTNALGSGAKVLFLDIGFVQDPALTPPINDIDLTSSNNRPAVSAFHQQRRFVAHTTTTPDAIWGSKVGQRSNFCRSSPLQDDDSLSVRIAQNQNHPVRHMVSVAAGLIVFTAAGEHRLVSADGAGGPLTPNSLEAIQDLYVGAAEVPPQVTGNAVVYTQARAKVVRDVQYDQAVEGLAGRDLTLFAGHLFEDYTVVGHDYQQNDHSIHWFVRSDGTLLGLTYIREQEIMGWHRHDTYTASGTVQSVVESICVVPEDHEDVLYLIVKRTINGGTKRYIERLETRIITDFDSQAMFLDSSLSRVSGAPISTLTGLDHLEGQLIGVVGDGAYLGTFTVAAGQVALGASYSKIHAGLLIEADLETLDLDLAESDVRDRKKRVGSVALLLQDSNRAFHVGIDEASLTPYQPGEGEDPTSDEFSGIVELPILTDHNFAGRVFLRQAVPLPLTILAAIPRVEIGG